MTLNPFRVLFDPLFNEGFGEYRLPPEDARLAVLPERLRPEHAVGIHVPVSVPDNPDEREPALGAADLFTRPGETRAIPHRHSEPANDEDRGARK